MSPLVRQCRGNAGLPPRCERPEHGESGTSRVRFVSVRGPEPDRELATTPPAVAVLEHKWVGAGAASRGEGVVLSGPHAVFATRLPGSDGLSAPSPVLERDPASQIRRVAGGRLDHRLPTGRRVDRGEGAAHLLPQSDEIAAERVAALLD